MGLLDRISFTKPEPDPPEAIDVTAEGAIRILWSGGPEATIPAAVLRDRCPCAQCVEEGTGRKLLDAATIPADIRPLGMSMVGNYAVKIDWSDGHSSGIYTWRALRDVAGIP